MLLLTEKEAAAWLPVVIESVVGMLCGSPPPHPAGFQLWPARQKAWEQSVLAPLTRLLCHRFFLLVLSLYLQTQRAAAWPPVELSLLGWRLSKLVLKVWAPPWSVPTLSNSTFLKLLSLEVHIFTLILLYCVCFPHALHSFLAKPWFLNQHHIPFPSPASSHLRHIWPETCNMVKTQLFIYTDLDLSSLTQLENKQTKKQTT